MWIEGNQRKHKKPYTNADLAKVTGFLEEKDAKLWLEKFFRENKPLLARFLTGVELLEFQSLMIEAMFNVDYFMAICSRGSGKSFLCAVFLILYAALNQGVKIGIIANSFRQARLLMQKIIDLRLDPKAAFLRQIISDKDMSFKNDEWVIRIGRSQIIALPTGCLKGDTRVIYENGIREISEDFDVHEDGEWIDKSDMVWSDGKFRLSDKKFYNGFAQTKKIKTHKGFNIEGTLNHKIKVVNENSEIEWRELKDIKEGDYVLIDRHEKPMSNNSGISENQAYFIGAMVGDGCWTSKYQLEFINTDPELVDNVKKATNYHWRTYDNNRFYALGKQVTQDFLDFWEVPKLYSYQKYIPKKIWNSDKKCLAAFLRGLYDTDGHCQTSTAKGGMGITIGYTTTSEKLAKDIQQALLCFGIVSFRKQRQRDNDKGRYKKLQRVTNEICVTGQNAQLFYEKIGFGISRKMKKLSDALSVRQRNNTINDGVPMILPELVKFLGENKIKKGKSKSRSVSTNDHSGVSNVSRKKFLTFELANKIIEKYGDFDHPTLNKLRVLANKNYFYDKVTQIEDSQCETFDLCVPENQTYYANGFVSHNTGEKLRGYRFRVMVIDELLLIPSKLVNEVIRPFLSTNTDVTERKKMTEAEDELIRQGKMTEDERMKWGSNKMIGLSSASYKFEHLYAMYQQYEQAILSGDNKHARYGIFHLSYECLPKELYDQGLISSARAEMSEAQFGREFLSLFSDDSSGYFKMSKMKDCTYPDGEGQMVEVVGEKDAEYILSGDVSWSESEGSDDFVFHVLKYFKETGISVLVHSYALPGTAMKEHIKYFHFLLKNFNIKFIVFDFAGGVQFLSAANESELFKSEKLEIKTIDVDVEDATKYNEDIKSIRNLYNFTENRICIQRKPSSNFLRQANELLQAAIDHRRIMFAGGATEEEFERQIKQNIPVNNLKFLRDNLTKSPTTVDFVENLKDNIEMTKTQCALIEATSTAQGTQSFDLPPNLKRQRGANKARRDSYSALVLGNWGASIYRDMLTLPAETVQTTFTPFFV